MANGLNLSMEKRQLEACMRRAQSAFPCEACGLLLGRKAGFFICVERVLFTDNVTAQDPNRFFEIDPAVHLKAMIEARRTEGPEIIGVWHSHPSGEACLSAEDRARSNMAGWVWLVSAPDMTAGVTGGATKGVTEGASTWHSRAFLAGDEDPSDFTELMVKLV